MKRLARVVLTLLIVAAGCAGGYELWDYYMLSPWTRDDARVPGGCRGDRRTSPASVDEVRVKDNQLVSKGDVLLILDQERYKRALALAQANVAARKADMENAKQVAARRAKLTNLSVSDDVRESSMLTASSAAAAYAQALARAVGNTSLALDRTVIRAPVNGFVTNLTLDVGQYAAIGTKVMALIDSDSYRITGYFEETKIPAGLPGRQVEIYPDERRASALHGHVESISRGITDRDNPAGPELLANVNPTFEWVRLTQRIPVRIRIDTAPAGIVIASGMTTTVVVEAPPRPWATLAALRRASFR